ncbi:PAS domain-containing protein [Dongia sp.]|uniref:PAS domain-containing protein n=1 Tax=Dongia sp. TaxID=1977262 RepID=UPI0035AD8E07
MSDPKLDDPTTWDGEVLYLPAPTGRSELIGIVQDYWQQKCFGRTYPTRADIDPLQLGKVLPYLSLTIFQPAPFRVQYRLAGSEVVRFYGAEMRGKWVDEITIWPPQDIIDTMDTYRRIHYDKVPNFGLSLIEWQGRKDHVFEFARFPISEDGEMVTHCLGVDDFTMIEPPRARAL